MKGRFWGKIALVLGLCMIFGTACGQKEEQLHTYHLITEQHIENDYFTMEAPEEFVGKVGYQCEQTEGGGITIRFVVDELAKVKDGVLAEDSGCILGGIAWTDIRYIAPLEDKTGITADVLSAAGSYRFDEAYPAYLEQYALGPEREALSYNSDLSGAYCGWVPTDVQWNPDNEGEEEKFSQYEGIWQKWLEEASFSAKVFPYEQLTEEEVAAYEADLAEALQNSGQ